MKSSLKKLGTFLCISLLLVSIFAVPSTSFAHSDYTSFIDTAGAQTQPALGAAAQNPSKDSGAITNTTVNAVSGSGNQSSGKCVPGNLLSFLSGAFTGSMLACFFTSGLVSILAWFAYYIMSLAGYLLGIIGILFDWLVVITIFQFGAYFGNSQGLLLAWGIIRDIANILILFGFLYAGIMMILDLHSFDARKSIPRLIIFAILLNFSLFAGEAIIDLANVISAQLYLTAGESTFSNCVGNLSSCGSSGTETGIAAVLIQDSYVGSSWTPIPTNTNGVNFTVNDPGQALKWMLAYIATTVFITILMGLLLIGGIMLVTRGIALVVLLVVSPLGFAGMAIPSLESRAQQWWHSLISNAVFAPVFLLLLFVGLKIVDSLHQNLGSGVSLATALTAPTASIGTILIIYTLVIGFFIAALVFAKSSGSAGAQFATNFVTKTARQTASSTAKFASTPIRAGARYGTGKLSSKAISAYNRQMGTLYEGGGVGKRFVQGMRLTGLDEGAQNLAQRGQQVKFGMKRSYKEEEEFSKKRTASLKHEAHAVHAEEAIMAAITTPRNDPRYQQVLADAQRVLLEASIQDVKNIIDRFKKDPNSKNLKKFIGSELTPDKFAKIVEDEHLDHDLKHDLLEGRYGEFHTLKASYDSAAAGAAKQAAFDALAKHLSQYTQKDFETALLNDQEARSTFSIVSPDGKGNSVIRSSEIRKNLAKNTSIPKSIRLQLVESSKENLLKQAMERNDAAAIRNLMTGTNMTEEVAEIGDDKLLGAGGHLSPAGIEFVRNLDTTRKLKAIADKKDGLSDTALHAIVDYVQSNGTATQKQLFKKFLTGNNSTLWAGRTIT